MVAPGRRRIHRPPSPGESPHLPLYVADLALYSRRRPDSGAPVAAHRLRAPSCRIRPLPPHCRECVVAGSGARATTGTPPTGKAPPAPPRSRPPTRQRGFPPRASPSLGQCSCTLPLPVCEVTARGNLDSHRPAFGFETVSQRRRRAQSTGVPICRHHHAAHGCGERHGAQPRSRERSPCITGPIEHLDRRRRRLDSFADKQRIAGRLEDSHGTAADRPCAVALMPSRSSTCTNARSAIGLPVRPGNIRSVRAAHFR